MNFSESSLIVDVKTFLRFIQKLYLFILRHIQLYTDVKFENRMYEN